MSFSPGILGRFGYLDDCDLIGSGFLMRKMHATSCLEYTLKTEPNASVPCKLEEMRENIGDFKYQPTRKVASDDVCCKGYLVVEQSVRRCLLE